MELTLRNVKVLESMSEETVCFSATIYIDGKRAGHAGNRGHGGPDEIDWTDTFDSTGKRIGRVYEEWLDRQTMPYTNYDGKVELLDNLHDKLEVVVGDAIEAARSKQWFKTKCRGKVLFRLKGDDDESWRTLKLRNGGKYTDETKAWMVKRYGDELAEIANETRI